MLIGYYQVLRTNCKISWDILLYFFYLDLVDFFYGTCIGKYTSFKESKGVSQGKGVTIGTGAFGAGNLGVCQEILGKIGA